MKRYVIFSLTGGIILCIAAIIYLYFIIFNGGLGKGPEFERGHPPNPYKNSEKFLSMLREDLNLSDQQFAAIKKMHYMNKEKMEKYENSFKEKIVKLEKLLVRSFFDEKNIRRLLEDMDALKREERLMEIKTRFEINKILSPQQREIINDRMKRDFDKLHGKFGRHDGPPPPPHPSGPRRD